MIKIPIPATSVALKANGKPKMMFMGNYGVVRSVERYSAPNALPTDLEAMNI